MLLDEVCFIALWFFLVLFSHLRVTCFSLACLIWERRKNGNKQKSAEVHVPLLLHYFSLLSEVPLVEFSSKLGYSLSRKGDKASIVKTWGSSLSILLSSLRG